MYQMHPIPTPSFLHDHYSKYVINMHYDSNYNKSKNKLVITEKIY